MLGEVLAAIAIATAASCGVDGRWRLCGGAPPRCTREGRAAIGKLDVSSRPTEPLIRYEVSDQLVVLPEPCPCGVGARRIDHVLGRADDIFTYSGGIRVHPLTLRAPLGRHRHVVEYQVIQTERGVRVRFCANGPVEPSELSTTIATGLRGCGLPDPEVTLEQVPELSRQVSGKLKRFVPRAPATSV